MSLTDVQSCTHLQASSRDRPALYACIFYAIYASLLTRRDPLICPIRDSDTKQIQPYEIIRSFPIARPSPLCAWSTPFASHAAHLCLGVLCESYSDPDRPMSKGIDVGIGGINGAAFRTALNTCPILSSVTALFGSS